MTEGPIARNMFLFILPLVGSSIFQQLYNTTDFLFVSNLLGKTAAAAVGASSTLVTCTIGLFSGIAVGTGVVISQAIGKGLAQRADQALHTSLFFGLVGGLVLMLIGILFAPDILKLLDTPGAILSDATLYIRIYFLSIPANIVYNMCAGALRACGDSQTPFRILALFGFANVLGDTLLIAVLPLGIAGAGIATILCQWSSLLAIVLVLHRAGRPIQLAWKKLHWDGSLMAQILRVGLPSGIQTVVITFSNVMVQYYINGFGETAVAAFATYYKVENFIYLPIMAFGQAATTFSGQNTGAGKYTRIRKGTAVAAGIGVLSTICIAGAILLFAQIVFGWFMKDSDVRAAAILIASISFPFYWIYPIMEVTGGSLRGMGYSISSMAIILLNLCVARIALLAVFSRKFRDLRVIASVYPITWAMAAICFVVLFLFVIWKKCSAGQPASS